MYFISASTNVIQRDRNEAYASYKNSPTDATYQKYKFLKLKFRNEMMTDTKNCIAIKEMIRRRESKALDY